MADFRLGRLKFKWKGDWAVSTAYVIDDIVKYGANTYVCSTNHTSSANQNLFYSTDVSNWSLHTEGLLSKGDWAASTWYKLNDVVKYGNNQYRVTTGHTSDASFAAANFVTYVEGLKYESTFAASTIYQVGDIVTYGGYTYVSKTNHTSTATTPNADSTNWNVLTTGYDNKGAYASGTAYAPGDVVKYGGYSYECILNSTGNAPTDGTYWKVLVEGFKWLGNWASGTTYQKGDCVTQNSNTYICITNNTTGDANSPANDPSGNYWNYIAQGGSAAQVLQTAGDLLYQAASGINRIALPAGSTGTAAEQRNASGQILTVGGSPLLPRWEKNNVTSTVYYVAEGGDDANGGDQIGRAFATIRYACDYITANANPSATNPITLYVKAGVYEEVLPIHVPAYTTIVGDNIRTTIVNAGAGNSNLQTVNLGANLTGYRLGLVVKNGAGNKTAKVIDSNGTNEVTILNVSGGTWTSSDTYVDVVDNKHADGGDLITNNAEFLAHEAWYSYVVANSSNPSGTEATVKAYLKDFAENLGHNVRAGGNDKVHEFATAYVGGTAITGVGAQDTTLINNIRDNAIKYAQGIDITPSTGNVITQKTYSGTADTASPKCAQVTSTITTLSAIMTTAITNSNMSHATSTNTLIAISSTSNISNNEATMFFLGTHTILKDMVFGGLAGFVPNGSDDKDIDGSTIKGVYLKLDPASPIQKSPYVQNCSAIGGAAVGAFIDGNAHKHFDNSPTPSFKSACFDAFTQVLEGGVGFYCKGTAALEVVSSFTYYHHISYISTGGGRIRAVSGNSSYGKYGCLSRGFDTNEVTTNGTVAGLRLNINPAGAKSGTFSQTVERISGGTSGAIGELRNDQSAAANIMYYLPVKGTFQNGELITGATSSATATLAAADAVTGAKGFTMVVEGLTTGPELGGSLELVDNGSNNDASSYVISGTSYAAPDGRGTLTVSRAQLGSSAAAHDGVTDVQYWDTSATTTTLQNSITSGASSPFNMDVGAVTGMVVNGYLVLGNELFKITAFVDADTVTVQRAQEGTSAAAHSGGDPIQILGTKSATQDETIADLDNSSTGVRVKASNVSFGNNDYIKLDNEFMKITAVSTDTTGVTILNLADEKVIAAGDGQNFKIRYRYSQVRLTAHDFLDVGTGNRTTTNWPYLPTQENVPAQEIDETRPGRVYYVSTDQDGNFAVGNFFKVEQSTGKATLNANAFDLTGLDTLRLGAIGAQLGATIDEFSTDGTLSQNSDVKVPTQKAVKTYVDASSAAPTLGVTTGSGAASVVVGTQNLVVAGTANEIETSGSAQTLTLGLPNDVTIGNDLTVTTDLVVGGTLTVNGTTTTVNSNTVNIGDSNLTLNSDETGAPSQNGGLTIERGTSSNVELRWNETSDEWEFTNDGSTYTAMGGGGGGITSMQVFTGTGTWTRPAGITKVRVFVTGGGGGGGGVVGDQLDDTGGGGAAGGTAIKIIDVTNIASVSVTVGNGGNGGGPSADGTGGSTSSFGNHCSASGGNGGRQVGNGNPAVGGVGSSGDMNIYGGGPFGGRGNDYAGQAFCGGHGGASYWGGGSTGSQKSDWGGTQDHNGTTNAAYGGGGAGGSGRQNTGNTGIGGVVMVEEY
tara:strand:- start:857 stop:5677 length:4821 start_codon:yes stop_codon:yes gene_type:complete